MSKFNPEKKPDATEIADRIGDSYLLVRLNEYRALSVDGVNDDVIVPALVDSLKDMNPEKIALFLKYVDVLKKTAEALAQRNNVPLTTVQAA